MAPDTPEEGHPDDKVTLSYSGKSWRLVLDLPGYEVAPVQTVGDGKSVKLSGEDPTTGMIITVFLESSPPGWTAIDHRENSLKLMKENSPLVQKDIKRSERGAMAILEYRVSDLYGIPIKQLNLNAYIVRDGTWVDVHLSKANFRPEDRYLFESVLDSIRFEE